MRKRILLSLIILIIICITVAVLVSYRNRKITNGQFKPKADISTEEYLEVSNIDELPFEEYEYAAEQSYLTHFVTMMITKYLVMTYYNDSDELPQELSPYISVENFRRLSFGHTEKADGYFIYFDINTVEVIHNYEKAVVFVGYNVSNQKYDDWNNIGSGGSQSIYIYFIKENNTWKVDHIQSFA